MRSGNCQVVRKKNLNKPQRSPKSSSFPPRKQKKQVTRKKSGKVRDKKGLWIQKDYRWGEAVCNTMIPKPPLPLWSRGQSLQENQNNESRFVIKLTKRLTKRPEWRTFRRADTSCQVKSQCRAQSKPQQMAMNHNEPIQTAITTRDFLKPPQKPEGLTLSYTAGQIAEIAFGVS